MSSSPDEDHSPVKTTNSANSRQLPVDPSYKLGSPRLVGELSRSVLNDVESFCDALGENTYPTHILPPPVVKRISTEQILQAQGNIRTGGAKTMCESPVIPNAKYKALNLLVPLRVVVTRYPASHLDSTHYQRRRTPTSQRPSSSALPRLTSSP
jgi:hypothetical protein